MNGPAAFFDYVNTSLFLFRFFRIGIKMMNVENLWNKANYGKGNVIAVIDSGCDKEHPDLKNNIVDGYFYCGRQANRLL